MLRKYNLRKKPPFRHNNAACDNPSQGV